MKRRKLPDHYSAESNSDGESMSYSNEEHERVERANESFPRRRTMLCSLRIVPVSSEHFLGRRYVMELTTTGRARELRVYRSLDQLMHGVGELGLPSDLRDGLCRQLMDDGECDPLDIVL
jgi:hypothetical protein